MKTVFAAAVLAALTAGSAMAQGLPPGSAPPNYGSRAFPNQEYQDKSVFNHIADFFANKPDASARTAGSHAEAGARMQQGG